MNTLKEKLRNKLNSNSGVTLVFALAVFMIVTVISMTIVTVALGNANRLARGQAQQQDNLAVSSAASLIRPFFDGAHAECLQRTDTPAAAPEWTFDYETGPLSGNAYSAFKTEFEKLITQGNTAAFTWKVAPPAGTPSEAVDALSTLVSVTRDVTTGDLLVTVRKGDDPAAGYAVTFRYQLTQETEDVYEEQYDDEGDEMELVKVGTLTVFDWLYTSRTK